MKWLPLMNKDSEEIKHLTHGHIQLFVYIISWDKHLQWSLWLFYKSLLFSLYKQMANQLVINKIYINIYHPFLLFLLDHFSARVCKTTLNLVLYVCVCRCVSLCVDMFVGVSANVREKSLSIMNLHKNYSSSEVIMQIT